MEDLKKELEEASNEIAKFMFEIGKGIYDLEQYQAQLEDLKVKAKNRILDAQKIQEKIAKLPVEVQLPEAKETLQ